MIEILLYLFIGWGLGILTGLVPGIHLNTITSILLFFQAPGELGVILLIVAMNTMHAFVDFIPSILLGAPSETTFVSTLPGHRLFLQGKGFHAIQCTILGGLGGTIGAIAFLPLYHALSQQLQPILTTAIPWVLSFTILYLIASEPTWKKMVSALFITLLSGSVGVISLSQTPQALFPLVTGFFGISTLLESIPQKKAHPPQTLASESLSSQPTILSVISGSISGALVSLFPAISTSHAAFLAQILYRVPQDRFFLILVGAINIASTIYSFAALQLLGKARTGSAVAIQQLYSISSHDFVSILFTLLASAGLAAITTQWLGKKAIHILEKLPYERVNYFTLIFLVLLTLVLSGITGLVILAIASAIGVANQRLGIKKSHCMAFLILPTIWFYWSHKPILF